MQKGLTKFWELACKVNSRIVGLMDKASPSGAGDSRLESWAAQGCSEWIRVGEICRRPNLARIQTSETGCICLRRHRMPKDMPPGCSLDSSTDQCMEASSATRPRLVGSGSLISDRNPSSQSKKEDLSPPRLQMFSTEREFFFSDKTMVARRQPLSPVES